MNKCFSTEKTLTCMAFSSPLYICSAKNNGCLYQKTSTWDWALSLPSVPQLLFSIRVLSGKTIKIFKHFLYLSEHWPWSQWHISVYLRTPLCSVFPSLLGNDEWWHVCESWQNNWIYWLDNNLLLVSRLQQLNKRYANKYWLICFHTDFVLYRGKSDIQHLPKGVRLTTILVFVLTCYSLWFLSKISPLQPHCSCLLLFLYSPLPLQKSILTSYDKQLHLAITNAGIGCSVEAALYPTPLLSFRNSLRLQVT